MPTPDRPPHLGNPHPTPLATWPTEMVRAVALAYRTTHAEGRGDVAAWRDATAAYLAHGGDPAEAPCTVPLIVSAVVRDHTEWFWPPVKARVEREEHYWRARGIWPPPMNRAEWPEIG